MTEPEAAHPPRSTTDSLFPIVGALVLAIELLGLAALFMASPSQAYAVGTATALLFLVGKEASIPTGIALGGNPFLVAASLVFVDSGLILLLQPVVDALLTRLGQRPGFLGGMVRRIERQANRKRHLVERYGAPGIFLFMLVPFAFNFPLVGATLGRVVGPRPWKTMAAIQAAILTTATAWTLLIAYGFSALVTAHTGIPIILSVTMTAIVLATGLIAGWREKRVANAERPEDSLFGKP